DQASKHEQGTQLAKPTPRTRRSSARPCAPWRYSRVHFNSTACGSRKQMSFGRARTYGVGLMSVIGFVHSTVFVVAPHVKRLFCVDPCGAEPTSFLRRTSIGQCSADDLSSRAAHRKQFGVRRKRQAVYGAGATGKSLRSLPPRKSGVRFSCR